MHQKLKIVKQTPIYTKERLNLSVLTLGRMKG
jgi:hypothetical protein